MKKVSFVRVKSELTSLMGLGQGAKYEFHVENIIADKLNDGWNYLGYVPVETRGNGNIETMSLIFEREE